MDRQAMAHELFRAVSLGKASEIKKLTKKLVYENPENVLLTALSSEAERNTILHVAAKHGCNDLVCTILKTTSLSSLVGAKNKRGNTPMHSAAASGHAQIITSLVSHVENADQEKGTTRDLQDMLTAKNEQGNTPVHEAAGKGRTQVMEMLLKSLDPTLVDRVLNEVNEVGETPLSMAIHAMSQSTVEAILKVRPNIYFKFRGPHNQNILHMTILKHDFDTMQLILRNQPELAREKDNIGRTALHYAASVGHTTFVRSLLKHDHRAAYIVDDNQMLPLHLAVAKNNGRYVTDELYKSDPTTMEFTDSKDQNVLHMAAKNGNVRVVAYLLQLPEIDELINSVDEDGNTPLNLSVNNDHSEIVHLLLEDPRVNLRAIDRETITDTFNKLHQMAASSSKKDEEKMSARLKALILKDDPKRQVNSFRFRIMSQAESIDDILELAGHADRYRLQNLPIDQKLKDIAGVAMLVATLVTTVTFALAFQLPGGYISDDDAPYKGTAVLSLKNTGFLFFVLFDVLAMTFSVSATSSLLIMLWSDNHRIFVNVLIAAMYLTACALVFVTLAFIAAMWTVFGREKSRLGVILVVVFVVVIAAWYLALRFAESNKEGIRKRKAMFL